MLRILYIVIIMFLPVSSELAAGGIYIASERPSHGNGHSIALERLFE